MTGGQWKVTLRAMTPTTALRISAVLGALGIALGAFGAHALKATLEAGGHIETWRTAAQYHLLHAVALTALALHSPARMCAWRLWLAGTIIFSGSLYALALTGLKWLGAITPFGGGLLLAGWLTLAFCGKKEKAAE